MKRVKVNSMEVIFNEPALESVKPTGAALLMTLCLHLAGHNVQCHYVAMLGRYNGVGEAYVAGASKRG